MNPVERAVRDVDCWQQRHPVAAFPVAVVKKFGDDEAGNLVALLTYYGFRATYPLLLALTAVLGVALRKYPDLHEKLVNSAFAEFPIVGAEIHEQLGVEKFSGTTLAAEQPEYWSPCSAAAASPMPCRTRSTRCGPYRRPT